MLRPVVVDFASTPWEGWALPGVGLAVAGLGLVTCLGYARRRAAAPERRQSPRSPGGVPVHIASADALPEPIAGWVLDRSAGGLCLSVERPVRKGTVLTVRPTKAPPGTPPVHVRVQRCQPDNWRWSLGCSFIQAPPANVLGLFGG